jgi:ribose transport system substrate-binding protein
MGKVPLRKFGALATTSLALVLGVSFAACGEEGTGGGAKTAASGGGGDEANVGQDRLIGFINPIAAQPILAKMQEALIAHGERLGYRVKALDSALKPDQEATNINTLSAEGASAMIVWLLGEGGGISVVKRAQERAGSKMIGFARFPDRKVPADMGPFVASIEQGSPWEGGELITDYVAEQLGDKGNVVTLGSCGASASVKLIVENYKRFLAENHPNVKVLAEICNQSDDIKGGQQATEQALTRFNNKIDAVIAYNDTSAIGAMNAMKAAGIENPITVGQNGGPDAVEAIKNGTESASVDTQPVVTAALMIEMVTRALEGKEMPKLVAAPVSLITKDNVGQHVSWDDQIKELQAGTLKVPELTSGAR